MTNLYKFPTRRMSSVLVFSKPPAKKAFGLDFFSPYNLNSFKQLSAACICGKEDDDDKS